MPTGAVDGLVSGMDTATVISQLMQLERQPQVRLASRKTSEEQRIAALQAVNNAYQALQSASDKLTQTTTWSGVRTTSSSSGVRATAAAGALTGSYTFDVLSTAKAQSSMTGGTTWPSTSARIVSTPTIQITKGGGDPVTVDVGDGSLASVIAGINGSSAGVKAAAIQVAPGEYRLSLTSTTTGADSTFGIVGDPLGPLQTLVAGADASVRIGEAGSPAQFTVESSTNTFADVLPGVTFTVSKEETGVVIDVTPDVDGMANAVDAMVKAANAVLDEIAGHTAYNPETKRGGKLVGDSTMRSLQQQLLGSMSTKVGTVSPADVGIELTSTGRITFDRAAFEAAYREDADAVARAFRPGGTTTHTDPSMADAASSVSLWKADDRLRQAEYAVVVTQAASQASQALTGAVNGDETITITVPDGDPLVVLLQAGDDQAAAASRLNVAITGAGLALTAAVENGEIVVRTNAYGSSSAVTVEVTGGTLALGAAVAGRDVAGTIAGKPATGTGQLLAAAPDDQDLWGLALLVTASDDDVTAAAAFGGQIGTFGYRPGLAQRLDSHAGDAIRSATGLITTKLDGAKKLIEGLDDQIAQYDIRLELREAQLRRQFTNLEVSLGKLRDQSNWLAGQIASLGAGAQ